MVQIGIIILRPTAQVCAAVYAETRNLVKIVLTNMFLSRREIQLGKRYKTYIHSK